MASPPPITSPRSTASPTSRCVEKGWLGGGNTGRNTTIIRSNYLWEESLDRIYEHAVQLWEDLSQRPQLQRHVLAARRHDAVPQRARRAGASSAHVHANRLPGIDNEWLTPEQAQGVLPHRSTSIPGIAATPSSARRYQRRGGTGAPRRGRLGVCACAAEPLGVDIIQNCEVTAIRRVAPTAAKVAGAGDDLARASSGHQEGSASSPPATPRPCVMDMAGVRMPLESYPSAGARLRAGQAGACPA
jgi:sarcosine oxidase subunit beta